MTEEKQKQSVMIGTMLRVVCKPSIILIAQKAGLDFVMMDMEHSAYSFETQEALAVSARGVGLRLFVRVPELAKGYVSRALDCGAAGIMVPMIETVNQARDLAGWAKYPPLGMRGLSSMGVHSSFSSPSDLKAFMNQANKDTLAIAQIETAKGIEAVDAIAAVDGIDVLLVGPNDLAVSLGNPGDLMGAGLQRAVKKVADAAARYGKRFGIHAGAPLIRKWAPHGLTLVINSTDAHILSSGMKSVCESMKQALKGGG